MLFALLSPFTFIKRENFSREIEMNQRILSNLYDCAVENSEPKKDCQGSNNLSPIKLCK